MVRSSYGLLLLVAIFAYSHGARRVKRNLLQLGGMIDCTMRRHDFIDYNGYGCWCGIGGNGTPLDATDRCCQHHDRCYDALHNEGGPCVLKAQTYAALYQRFNCNTCADMSAYNHWWYKLFLASPTCRSRLCQCDSHLVRCLRRAESTFNPSYRFYYKRITACPDSHLRPWLPFTAEGGVSVPTYLRKKVLKFVRYDRKANSIEHERL